MIPQKGVTLLKLCHRCLNIKCSLAGVWDSNSRWPTRSFRTSTAFLTKNLRKKESLVFGNGALEDKNAYADTFGNIESLQLRFQRTEEDPEDIKEYASAKAAQGKTLEQYTLEILEHLKRNRYKEALHVLEIDMINDRVKANAYIYRLFLTYNAYIGDIKEAYRLYTNFKKKNGIVSGSMYTSLFNACANCKNSLLALEKAEAVREYLMNDKNHAVNLSNYNAMIKAFGRHGDLPTCLKIVDEVLERRDKVNAETFCFLMQACASDKNSGLRHALIAWRKMLQNRCVPTVFEFNTILRCVRDCFLGDIDLLNSFIKQLLSESKKFYMRKVLFRKKNGETKRKVVKICVKKDEAKKYLTAKSLETRKSEDNGSNEDCKANGTLDAVSIDQMETVSELDSEKNEKLNEPDSEKNEESKESDALVHHFANDLNLEAPNLLSLNPTIGSVFSFGSLTRPYERFLCVGGVKGFLKTMSEFGVKPDVKTFTLMLDVVPKTLEAEEQVIAEAKANGVKLDTAFFNVLIKRRAYRTEATAIPTVLKLMHEEEVSPDIITFGVLALGCATHENGKELIKVARQSGFRLNSEMLGALLERAKNASDMNYVRTILNAAKEDGTELSPKFIGKLGVIVAKEKHKRKTQAKVLEDERNNMIDSSL